MIHYNDKTVKIEPDQPLNIKWINGKNGLKSVEPKKVKHLNLDVPVVSFRRVERLSKSGIARSFKMPTPYVCCAMEEEETNRNETEYDLDREDLTWLQMANARRHKAKRPSIDECTLERAIDMLEKESHFQVENTEFCQWLCRRCQMSPSIPVDCALCSCTSGAFKQTSDGRWAHVVCAIWLNEVHFGNTVFLEPVEGVGFSIKRRRKLTCLICKRKVGACLQCSNKACVRSFHATCARYAGMKMVVKESRARNNADSITINRFAYCFQHSNPNRSGQTMASWKREMENNIKEARKMLDIKAKQTLKSVPVPVIPKEKVEDIAQKLGLNYVNDIYSYWSLKRKSRFGVPLIRRLQVYMNQQKPLFSGIPFDQNGGVDVDEAVVAAESSSAPPPLEEIQSGPATTTTAVVVVDPLKRYAALRRNFERVRLLCDC
uniref:PHD-type domain-containing protein n=1 Tax=Globodera pallida TaxID=36090 RepID=A0A183BZP1_GLOPA